MAVDDHNKLLRSIANAIRRSKCSEQQIVHALMSTAAGMAAGNNTHCGHAFIALAHEMYHDAENVIEAREPEEYAVLGVGGYKC